MQREFPIPPVEEYSAPEVIVQLFVVLVFSNPPFGMRLTGESQLSERTSWKSSKQTVPEAFRIPAQRFIVDSTAVKLTDILIQPPSLLPDLEKFSLYTGL